MVARGARRRWAARRSSPGDCTVEARAQQHQQQQHHHHDQQQQPGAYPDMGAAMPGITVSISQQDVGGDISLSHELEERAGLDPARALRLMLSEISPQHSFETLMTIADARANVRPRLPARCASASSHLVRLAPAAGLGGAALGGRPRCCRSRARGCVAFATRPRGSAGAVDARGVQVSSVVRVRIPPRRAHPRARVASSAHSPSPRASWAPSCASSPLP